MRSAALVFTHIVLLASFSTPLAALETDEADRISRDPQKAQEATARLKTSTANARSAAASSPKVAVKAQPASVSPTDATDAKQPDTINALLAKNQGKPWYERQYSPCPGFVVLLRQDWMNFNNTAGAECPGESAAGLQGAQISYSDDRITNNRSAAIHGTAALVYNSATGDPPAGFIPYATSFGVYVTANDVTNSAKAQTKSNANTTDYGGVIELGFVSPGGSNTIRVLGGGSEDNLKHTSAGNAAAQWYPVYYPLNINTPISQPAGIPIIVRFEPDLAVRYDGTTGTDQIVPFNERQQSMRLGPELALHLQPYPTAPAILANFSAVVGYDWYYESYTRKDMNWFTTSVSYYLDAQQHVGITGRYDRGRDLQNGASTNVYTLSLSGKL